MIKFYSNFEQDEKIGYNYDREEMKLAENEVVKTIDEINRYLDLIGDPKYKE